MNENVCVVRMRTGMVRVRMLQQVTETEQMWILLHLFRRHDKIPDVLCAFACDDGTGRFTCDVDMFGQNGTERNSRGQRIMFGLEDERNRAGRRFGLRSEILQSIAVIDAIEAAQEKAD